MTHSLSMANAMEPIVKTILEELQQTNPLKCACNRCKLDTIVIALNHLQPKYVTSLAGEIYIKTLLLNNQLRSDVVRELTKAAELVGQNPRHEPPAEMMGRES